MFKEMIKRVIPDRYFFGLKNIFKVHSIKSYSQEGEDVILNKIFIYKKRGFYLDIGAHHPKRYSNTYLFYRRGWRGINIDARPGSMSSFKRKRPRDINLEMPVTEKKETLTYYAFKEPVFNSFSKELSLIRENEGIKLLYKKEMEGDSLASILDRHLPSGTQVDFISIDVEGFDLQVLKSNNWDKYKPAVLVVEILGNTLESMMETDTYNYLAGLGYVAVAKCVNSCIFQLNNG